MLAVGTVHLKVVDQTDDTYLRDPTWFNLVICVLCFFLSIDLVFITLLKILERVDFFAKGRQVGLEKLEGNESVGAL